MGYTILYSTHIMGAIQLYHIFDSLVKMVLMHPNHVVECYDDKICLKTELNPAGVPAWKIFAFYFWQNSQTPHGRQWTLSPEDYGTNTYLGYSIEAQCALLPFIPHAQREKQVYILAKFWRFFEPNTTAWPPEFYDAAAVETGVRFITGSDAKNQLPSSRMYPSTYTISGASSV
ncbi:hypothetical protein C8F01DRAFT_433759 [Mycena amicta]|nr:hypothetical protein C8F01DRAFT_433759 [Mycena amicta]